MTTMPALRGVRALSVAALVLTVPRCEEASVRPLHRDEAVLQGDVTTDKSEYQLRNGSVEIQVRFDNNSSRSKYLTHCGFEVFVIIERLAGADWRVVEPIDCVRVGVPAAPVAPGASRTILVRLQVGPSVTALDLSGTFRARLPVYEAVDAEGRPAGTPLPATAAMSSTFTIRP